MCNQVIKRLYRNQKHYFKKSFGKLNDPLDIANNQWGSRNAIKENLLKYRSKRQRWNLREKPNVSQPYVHIRIS